MIQDDVVGILYLFSQRLYYHCNILYTINSYAIPQITSMEDSMCLSMLQKNSIIN